MLGQSLKIQFYLTDKQMRIKLLMKAGKKAPSSYLAKTSWMVTEVLDTDNLPKQQHEKFWIEARCVSLHKLFLIITHQIVVSTATEMITFPPLDKKQMEKNEMIRFVPFSRGGSLVFTLLLLEIRAIAFHILEDAAMADAPRRVYTCMFAFCKGQECTEGGEMSVNNISYLCFWETQKPIKYRNRV